MDVTDGLVLVSERLELWRPVVGDRDEFHRLSVDGVMRRYLGRTPASEADSFARFLRNAGSWDLYGYGTCMVREHGRPAVIGSCGLFHSWRGFAELMNDVVEAGWIIAHAHWGLGYASEAMSAILANFDAANGPTRITCMIDAEHAASDKVARRLGFQPYDTHVMDDGERLVLYERVVCR